MAYDLQLLRAVVDTKQESRPALLVPAIVYAQLVQLNIASVKGQQCPSASGIAPCRTRLSAYCAHVQSCHPD